MENVGSTNYTFKEGPQTLFLLMKSSVSKEETNSWGKSASSGRNAILRPPPLLLVTAELIMRVSQDLHIIQTGEELQELHQWRNETKQTNKKPKLSISLF